MSKMQRDMQRIAAVLEGFNPHDAESKAAWQRLKARLSPDREAVAGALKRAYMPRFALEELDLSRWDSWETLADAAIGAMREP